ncbi:hypothetical protein SAY87_028303 [Trapa incisa]|uniref:Uncharacterized protein n=1 Tax=Trapa incisa TaxID=236973 RepID=A0AAN7QNI3_9MYRT|nr:hypothetical protein SAY87_028303 [Trapa incisa]
MQKLKTLFSIPIEQSVSTSRIFCCRLELINLSKHEQLEKSKSNVHLKHGSSTGSTPHGDSKIQIHLIQRYEQDYGATTCELVSLWRASLTIWRRNLCEISAPGRIAGPTRTTTMVINLECRIGHP